MKKLTSFTHLVTGEGDRVAFTYSEVSNTGELVSQNNKEGFIVMDAELQAHIDAVRQYIAQNRLR